MFQTISKYLGAFLFLLLLALIAILPFPVLYAISNFFSWLLGNVFKYRLKVIEENLKKSDLPLSDKEREHTVKAYYRNLSDIILEGLKSFSMSQRTVIKRHRVVNPELLNRFHAQGKSVIVVTGHIGNWEWGSLSAGIFTNYNVVAFYSPMRNKPIDKMMRWSRSRFGTILSPTKGTTNTFAENKDCPTLYVMAADQSPSKVSSAHWIHFLGRTTGFLHGPEKHARHNNYPVIFAEIDRIKRGHYELELKILTEKPIETAQGEITRQYAKVLEDYIRRHPDNWLWSHRRWKRKPPQ
ncbi:lysophospholipid acyltransferase family protein [Marinilabilia sp.]|uniref:lysophospholipid acyltransferase family protein n=1 Tax=Marinilabilia sp. TaxID=2021252 RepID=UPI0025BD798D|nr:lysophospholipid acyltransferase family protein [Marinilabilia sp.]